MYVGNGLVIVLCFFASGRVALSAEMFLPCIKRHGAAMLNSTRKENATLLGDVRRRVLLQCVQVHQSRCEPRGVVHVPPWPWGFGSAVNLWIQSFVVALERGLTLVHDGAFPYADESKCPLNPGFDCYFQPTTTCQTSKSTFTAKQYAMSNLRYGNQLLVRAAKALQVPPGWVWGNLALILLRLKPFAEVGVTARANFSHLGFIPERETMALQIRVGTSAAPINDGREQNRGSSSERFTRMIDEYMRGVQRLAANKQFSMYIVTDAENVSADALNERYASLGHHFTVPVRTAVDIGCFDGDHTKHCIHGIKPPSGRATRATVTLDLLADIWIMMRADYLLGSDSNLFYLAYGLRLAQSPHSSIKRSCWMKGSSLLCSGSRQFLDSFVASHYTSLRAASATCAEASCGAPGKFKNGEEGRNGGMDQVAAF